MTSNSNLFEALGWDLGKITPQKASTNGKHIKKRKTDQMFIENKKKRKLFNNKIHQKEQSISRTNKNKEQFDRNNDSKKHAQYIKGRKLKYQAEQKKCKKSTLQNIENPFINADNFGNAEKSTQKIILKSEELNKDKSRGTLEKMKKKLSEGKFRWINEQLYTTTGSKALEMFQKNSQLFDEYHDGFRSVVESWPVNPVDLILKYLKNKPKEIIVADLGCGEGKIGLEAPNKVLSFDLVAKHDKVIVCDIARLPVPDDFFDIAIFCLSLMGTNYIEYLKEAYRVLKLNGELKIAEVVSRFSDFNAFIDVLDEIGFKLLKEDDTNKMFILFDFVKKRPRKTKKSQSHHNVDLLKPCVYKKR